MPITFKSKHAPNIIMLEAVAIELLHLMGHSGSVPGSLATEDLPRALSALESAVSAEPARRLDADREGPGEHGAEQSEDAGDRVSVGQRAGPLLDMLRAARANDDYVIWDR